MKPLSLKHSMIRAAGLFLVAAALSGCGKEPTPPPPDSFVNDPNLTPVVQAAVGQGSVTLTWTVADSSRASEYRIFRVRQGGAGFAFLASSHVRTYTDATVQNGALYFYQVSQITTDGKSSLASDAVSATPGIFSVQIDQGRSRTNSLSLSLSLSAPAGTLQMRVSEDPTFSTAAWETFSGSRSFTVLPGDGERTVFAQFQDATFHLSQSVSDRILLDTQAFIDSTSYSPAGAALSPGTVIHLRLKPRGSEIGGVASVDIGQRIKGLQLQDQGANGDQVPGDGIYELDFTLPRGSDVLNAQVAGHFTDAAGNKAPDVPSSDLLTLHTVGGPVTLLSVKPGADPGSSSLDLAWSPYAEGNFQSYLVQRADAPGGVVPAPAAFGKLTTLTDRSAVSFSDAGSREGQTYAYRVDVVDSLGFTAAGNVVVATARSLAAVTLSAPQAGLAPDTLNVVLNWSQTLDPAFSSYQVMRAEGSDAANVPADVGFSVIRTESAKTGLSYSDVAPKENSFLWYRVDELSTAGARHRSNALAFRTSNASPPAVTLSAPFEQTEGQVSLSWTRSAARDFAYYRIYRARGANADTSLATLLQKTNSINAQSFIDSVGLEDATAYFYRVWTTDKGGLATSSSEQSYTTKNQPPTSVLITGAGPAGPGASLTWQVSNVTDFDSYKVYRARDASVSNGSTLLTTITDRHSTGYLDAFGSHGSADTLKPNADYYYRVYVFDKGGLSAGGNAALIHTGPWSQAALLPQAVRVRRAPLRSSR